MISNGYSGDAKFKFGVVRYRDKETGELFAEEFLENLEDDFEYEYVSIVLSVEGHSCYYPARYGKYPEDFDPADEHTEIESVTDINGNNWYNQLTQNEKYSIIERIAETVKDSSDDYYDYSDLYQDYN